MKILLTGASSTICQALIRLLPPACEIIKISRETCDFSNLNAVKGLEKTILECDKIVLAHGTINSKKYLNCTEEEIVYSLKVNLLSTVGVIEIALGNPKVRIVAIGSESGLKGSYAVTYGLSKMALHKYIEERKIEYPDQQLVCVAPSLIEDSGMTQRRQDQANVVKAIVSNPKGRGLFALEVAKMVHYLLFIDLGYTTNVVIHMNGGKYARS